MDLWIKKISGGLFLVVGGAGCWFGFYFSGLLYFFKIEFSALTLEVLATDICITKKKEEENSLYQMFI